MTATSLSRIEKNAIPIIMVIAGLSGGKISRQCEPLCHYILCCTRRDHTVLLEWGWSSLRDDGDAS